MRNLSRMAVLLSVLWVTSVIATDVCNCKGYAGVGGPCYAGVGGAAYAGVGGAAARWSGGTSVG